MAVKKDPRTIELAEPFVSLFPVDPETLRLVTNSIREHGFQIDKPILMWKDAFGERGRQVVVDGHTRVKAAIDLKLPEIWATVRQYKNLDAAITAGIGEQVQRRNMNREQIAAYVVALLPMLDKTRGGLRTRTSKQLAELLGVSVPTIDRARGVLRSGDEELIADVKEGRKSLLAAYDITTGRADNPHPAADDPEPEPQSPPPAPSKPRLPTKAEVRNHTKALRVEEMFRFRKDEHPNPEAYEAMLDAIVDAEDGRSSIDFELDATAAFDLAFEQLHHSDAS
jgi:ParB-like nuclease domain